MKKTTPNTIIIRDLVSDMRPEMFGDIYGQDAIVSALKRYCISSRPPKGILLSAQWGGGKTSIANVFVKSMACSGRPDSDPEPCCRCPSCTELQTYMYTDDILFYLPDWRSDERLDQVLKDVRYSRGTLFRNYLRPIPLLIDDINELSQVHQQQIRRAMDGAWGGCLVAASACPDKIDSALRDRLQEFSLQVPDLGDMVRWVRKICKKTGLDVEGSKALENLVAYGRNNFRSILRILQHIQGAGGSVSRASVAKAAAMGGYTS